MTDWLCEWQIMWVSMLGQRMYLQMLTLNYPRRWGPSFSNHWSMQSIHSFIHSFMHPERPLLKSFIPSGSVEQHPAFSLNSSDEGSVKVVKEMCFPGFYSVEIYRAVGRYEHQPLMVHQRQGHAHYFRVAFTVPLFKPAHCPVWFRSCTEARYGGYFWHS